MCSKLTWSMLIYDFSESRVKLWQADLQRIYKRWLGLPRCTEVSVLYRPCRNFGLNLKQLPLVLKRQQVTKWHIMQHSKDPTARAIFEGKLQSG